MDPILQYISKINEFGGIRQINKDEWKDFPIPTNCCVSVVIPAYNEAKTILTCLESLIDQENVDGSPLLQDIYEVIVVNNNSTDNTFDVVQEWICQVPNS